MTIRALLAHTRLWLLRLSSMAAAATVGAFAASVIYVVVLRQLTGATPDWGEELPRLLLVWSVFIGMVPATLNRSHFAAGISSGDESWMRRLLVAGFFALMAASGWYLTVAGLAIFSPAMHLSYAATYAAVPVGCTLSAIAMLLPRPEDVR